MKRYIRGPGDLNLGSVTYLLDPPISLPYRNSTSGCVCASVLHVIQVKPQDSETGLRKW